MNPLDELERLHREATPGPLTVRGQYKDVLVAEGGLTVAKTIADAIDGDARILATSRNIVPQVIALARAVSDMRAKYSTTQGSFDALDALLQVIESEVSR